MVPAGAVGTQTLQVLGQLLASLALNRLLLHILRYFPQPFILSALGTLPKIKFLSILLQTVDY